MFRCVRSLIGDMIAEGRIDVRKGGSRKSVCSMSQRKLYIVAVVLVEHRRIGSCCQVFGAETGSLACGRCLYIFPSRMYSKSPYRDQAHF